MSFIKLTDHAKHRSLKRFGIGAEKLRELAEKAVIEGYSYRDAPNDKSARYLERHARENKAYVWSDYIFILTAEMVLITTYRMPKHLLMSMERVKTYIGVD